MKNPDAEKQALLERRNALLVSLRRERKRRLKVIEKVRADLARAEGAEEERLKGELLKSALPDLRRGLSRIEVVNYFHPDLEKLWIELDPALGPQENIAALFKRYRKGRRALPLVQKRLARLEVEEAAITELICRLEAAESVEAVEALENEARGLSARRPPARPAGQQAKAHDRGGTSGSQGPRRFVSAGGHEILVGRNARGNDELTLRIARGNDLFLHVAGSSGAHVIVRTPPGKSIPTETLLDAAQLALYYSLPQRLKGLQGAGAAADVDYTCVKFVRKPRGSRPGLVLLIKHKSIRVRLERQRLERLLHPTAEAAESAD